MRSPVYLKEMASYSLGQTKQKYRRQDNRHSAELNVNILDASRKEFVLSRDIRRTKQRW